MIIMLLLIPFKEVPHGHAGKVGQIEPDDAMVAVQAGRFRP